jgi:hypothetical protein
VPFENLETITRDNMPPTALISYMPTQGHGKNAGKVKKDSKPRLVITLPTTICGLAKADRWALQLGSGPDAGKLRIKGLAKNAPAKQGIAPSEMKNCFKFNFGFVTKLGDDHFDGERRPVRKISDDEFEIDIPASWFEG